jgi:hypothetical protein
MIKRSDLEIPRTPDEMEKIIHELKTYPNSDIYLRKGPIKDILEGYWPLYILAHGLSDVNKAWLTRKSNKGPDAYIQMDSGKKISIQITVADESYENAKNRELLNQNGIVFITTKKERDKKTRKIVDKGRGSRKRDDFLRNQVERIISSIINKIKNFHEGTDILLVSAHIRSDISNISYSWRYDLKKEVNCLENIPYSEIYFVNDDELIVLKK